MSEQMITALLAFLGTIIGTFGGIIVSNKLVNYRIEQLEKKVEKHNHVVDRTYRLEQRDAVVSEDIKVINHRISDLENLNK